MNVPCGVILLLPLPHYPLPFPTSRPVIIFPIMPLKKINLILKVSLLLTGWPSWLSDGANETQVRRTSPYGTVSYFFA